MRISVVVPGMGTFEAPPQLVDQAYEEYDRPDWWWELVERCGGRMSNRSRIHKSTAMVMFASFYPENPF